MGELALAALVFVALHILPAIKLREVLIARIGDPAYMGLFSLASIIGLGWMISAYNRAPASDPLWISGPALRWATVILMLLAFVFVVFASTPNNPTAVKGGSALKKERVWTNIFAITRHPLMWGIALWAFLHLLNRPDATSLLFFGPLLFLAIAGAWRQEIRKHEQFGEHWNAFTAQTSFVPFVGLLTGKSKLDLKELAGWRLVIAIALWLGILFAHGHLFGVYPLGA